MVPVVTCDIIVLDIQMVKIETYKSCYQCIQIVAQIKFNGMYVVSIVPVRLILQTSNRTWLAVIYLGCKHSLAKFHGFNQTNGESFDSDKTLSDEDVPAI